MAKWDLSVTRLNNVLALKEKNGGWKPDKTNLNILETKGFIIGKTIGEGKYSKVKKAFCTRTKETVAIKIIHKSRLHPGDCQKFIPRELEILRTLQHHGLVILVCTLYLNDPTLFQFTRYNILLWPNLSVCITLESFTETIFSLFGNFRIWQWFSCSFYFFSISLSLIHTNRRKTLCIYKATT